MSNSRFEGVSESPVVGRYYCPGCEPDVDPTRDVFRVNWCAEHIPDRKGVDDNRVTLSETPAGSRDVEGSENRKWCDLLHRGKIKLRS